MHPPPCQQLQFNIADEWTTPWQDLVATNRALQNYTELDNSFQGTREFALLTDLTQAVEQGDTDAFGDRLYEYDQLSKLDKWKTAIFLRIKNNIEETGEDFS